MSYEDPEWDLEQAEQDAHDEEYYRELDWDASEEGHGYYNSPEHDRDEECIPDLDD